MVFAGFKTINGVYQSVFAPKPEVDAALRPVRRARKAREWADYNKNPFFNPSCAPKHIVRRVTAVRKAHRVFDDNGEVFPWEIGFNGEVNDAQGRAQTPSEQGTQSTLRVISSVDEEDILPAVENLFTEKGKRSGGDDDASGQSKKRKLIRYAVAKKGKN
jgi:hypothetical protein